MENLTGGPVVKPLCFYGRGHSREAKIPHATRPKKRIIVVPAIKQTELIFMIS